MLAVLRFAFTIQLKFVVSTFFYSQNRLLFLWLI